MSRTIAKQYELPSMPAPVAKTKPRYSYSQVEAAKCGAKHNYLKTFPKSKDLTYNLAAGTMMDTAFNAYYENNQHLVETHEERMEYARAAIDLLLKDHPEYYTIDWSAKAGDPRSSPENYTTWLFELKALELVCRHDRGPVEVQKKVELDLPDYVITGYIDCLETDTNTIVDVKSVTGWGNTTVLQYALRSQVPLYRMLLRDSQGLETKGRYELVLCRKTPKLITVLDADIDYLQTKLVADFEAHHKKLTSRKFDRNPDHCLDYNRPCQFLKLCWPELTGLVEQPN